MPSNEKVAAERARGRARNGTRSGSALEQVKNLMRMDCKTWEDIEGDVIHLADFAGLIQQTSTTMNGGVVITVAAPLGYAHAALDVSTLGRAGAVFFRAYMVPMDAMFMDEIEGNGDGDGE